MPSIGHKIPDIIKHGNTNPTVTIKAWASSLAKVDIANPSLVCGNFCFNYTTGSLLENMI